jgi:ABC-type multidrug transport system fused ATPase/permease subunit
MGWIMSELIWVLSDFYNPETSVEEYRKTVNNYVFVFLGLSVASFIFYGGQTYLFNRVGEGLTKKLREDVFIKIISMPIGWFDEAENNPGSLAVKLQSEAQLVNNLTSSIVGIQVSNTSALVTGMIIAFYFNWRITLVSLGLAPFMMLAGQI